MKSPQGSLNHFRAEAAKLPAATCHGERCISPGNVPFQARVEEDTDGGEIIGWAPAGPDWRPLGLLFGVRSL